MARRTLALTLTLAALALAGCTDDAAGPGEQAPSAQQTAEGVEILGQWPLTGLPADGPAPEHPVMVVKIDNSSGASPQLGLGRADLVVEELVEGGITRLAVFYHSELPRRVGPVRSMRATDIGIVQPADAVLVASGGAPPTVRRVADAEVETVTEGAPGFVRDDARVPPYNLMMELPRLARTLKADGPPEDYLPWGSAEELPKGKAARTVQAEFSGGHTTRWRYQGGGYVNENSFAAAGDRFRPATVLVLRVQVGDAGYRDPAGNPVPETRFTGRGQALLFHGGRVVRGTWAKDGLDAPLELATKAGPLTVPAGRTWIELVPADGGAVRFAAR